MTGKLAEIEVRVAFQPVLRTADLSVFGYEALFRGAPDPGALFKEAVRQSFARDLDAEVCRHAAASFLRSGRGALFVNLTPPTFLSPDGITDALRRLPPRRVVLEITEQAFEASPGEMAEAAAWWRQEGFLLAVDDVGSGQSRVLALAEVRPDFVKVDRALLAQAVGGGAPLAVLQHMVAAARALGAAVVAEGIETGEELHLVRALGIELGQGFLLGRPGPLPMGGRRLGPADEGGTGDSSGEVGR